MKEKILLIITLAFLCDQAIAYKSSSDATSIIEVISNYSEFKGKRVIITGILGVNELEKNGYAVFLDKGSQENHVYKNAIVIYLHEGTSAQEKEKIQSHIGKYVSLVGVVDKSFSNDGSSFSGKIIDVEKISLHQITHGPGRGWAIEYETDKNSSSDTDKPEKTSNTQK